MQRDLRKANPHYGIRIGTALLVAAFFQQAAATGHWPGYSHSHYYRYGVHENLRLRREIGQLDDQLKRQQRRLNEQTRQQGEQTRLLRQQQAERLQTTGRQACYYRLDGGLDLCDRLFGAASPKHAACVETARELNAGCAEHLARPANLPGD